MTAVLDMKKAGLKKIFDEMNKRGGLELLVGIPKGEKRDDDIGLSNAEIGYIHEMGVQGRIPARPFLNPSLLAKRSEIADLLKPSKENLMSEDALLNQLNIAGLACASFVKDYMQDSSHFTPLSPVTIKMRQNKRKNKQAGDKPLIDTASLRNSITYVIKGGY